MKFLGRRELLRLAGVAGIGVVAPNLLLGCASSTRTAAPTYAGTISSARDAMRNVIADPKVSSISAALADGDRIIWAEAFGTIDKARGLAPSTETMFGIGSVSKMFAAIAAMILVDRGLVDLDAPLVRYVKDFRMASPQYTQITVRMLLSHSSGLPGIEWRNSTTTVPVAGYAKQIVQTLATARLKHAPGEMAVYCDDGFAMIELVVTAVTGKSYVQFVADEILVPLGMNHSRYTLTVFPVGSYAPGYKGDAKQPLECLNCYGGGGLYSTPSDMARLAMMLMNGGELAGRRVLSAAAVAEMARDQTASLPFNPIPTYTFGLGWDGVTQAGLEAVGVTAWHKNGGTVYYGSEFFIAPAERLAVFVNGLGGYNPLRLCELIMLHALAERGSIKAMPSPLPNVAWPERAPADADLAAIAGCYGRFDSLLRLEAQLDRTLTLFKDVNGTWQASAAGLKLRDNGTYSSDSAANISYRAMTADGRRYLVARVPLGYAHYDIEVLYGQRMLPGPPLSTAWQARVGGQWLAVNHHPLAIAPILNAGLHAVPELPGYVITNAGQIVNPAGDDARARMCLKIPIFSGMQLNDVVIEVRHGEDWLRIGSVLYRPMATVPALAPGSHAVTIGAEGHGEWRKLPVTGTVSIAGAVSWIFFDADLAQFAAGEGGGSASLPGKGGAAYLLVYGTAGAVIRVSVA